MTSAERLGNDPKGADNILGLLSKPFQADRNERTRIFDLASKQCASLTLTEVEIGAGYSGLAQDLCQGCSMPRGVLANIHDGEMEPEDLGEPDDVVQVTVSYQMCTLVPQRFVDDQEILQ